MSVDPAERRARAALTWIVEPETRGVAALVRRDGPVETWQRLATGHPELPPEVADGLRARTAECRPDADLDRIQRLGGRFVCPGDAEWPDRLDDLWHAGSHPPIGLWVRGPAALAAITRSSVAIVGARAASSYGDYIAAELAAGLGCRDWTVVSGGAYGIDGSAHRGALAVGAPTVVVLAGGVDVAYPRGHETLFEQVAREHLVLSEAAPGCAPHRARFLVRNRLIAALTRGTVVVEAAARSGALSTAARASALHRPLLAVPGPVTSTMSAGCHVLIRDRGAVLVCDAEQVLEQVAAVGEYLAPELRGPERPDDRLPPVFRQVLEAVPVQRAAGPARIAMIAGVDESSAKAALRALAAYGLVEKVPGGWRLGPGRAHGRGAATGEGAAGTSAADRPGPASGRGAAGRDAPQEVLDLGL